MANNVSVELSMNTTGYQEGINGAIDSTKKYETEVRKVSESTINFRKEFIKAKREVQNLAAGYAQLDKEAKKSAFGREMARQLEEAKQKAAEYIDLQGDLQAELNNMASDTRALDTLSEGLEILGNSTSTVLGIIAEFTGEEKDAQRAVVAFTTAISAANTVTKIANALQPYSNTMKKIGTLQDMAAATAINIKTAAEGKSIITTKAATVAQALFNKVAYANPYVLLAMALAGVTAALVSFISFTRKSAEEEEREQRIAERQEQVHKAYYDTLNSELDKTIPKYIQLQEEWKNLRTEGEKLQWIKDNKDKFEELGVQIDNVNDAENFLETQTQAVMQSFIQRAKSIAIAQQAAEIYKQALEDIQWLEQNRGSKSFKSGELKEHGFNTNNARIDHHGGALGTGHARYEITDYDAQIQQRQKAAEEEMRKLYQEMGRLQSEGEKALANAGVKQITKGNKQLTNARKQVTNENKKVIHKGSVEEAEELVKTWETALKQVDINDTELVKNVTKRLEDAKKELQRRKITVGLEVKADITVGSPKWLDSVEKELKDKIANAVEGSPEWHELNDKLNEFQSNRKIQTEGFTKDGSKKLGPALRGEFEHSMQGYSDAISVIQNKLQSIDWSTPEGKAQFDRYVEKIQEFKGELSTLSEVWEDAMMTPTEKAQKKLEDTADTINTVGNAISATSELFSALGDVAGDEDLQVAGIVAKAVATVALSFAQALTTAKSWVDWLAFGVTGLTTMLTMISSIKQATAGSFAEGGIIGGSSYSGDKLLANVNSGEMILNSRQQRNLFNLLDTGTMPQRGGTNVQVTGVVRGTDLLLVQKNTNKVRAKSGSQIYF